MKPLVHLIRNLFRRAQVEQELDDEMSSWVEMRADEHEARGLSRDAAVRAARLDTGGVEQLKEEVRDVRFGAWLELLWRDVRFAARTLLHSPGVTAVVVLSLGLAIGANTAIFSMVNALLMKSLPVDRPEQLVLLSNGYTRGFVSGQKGRWSIYSYPLYRHLRDNQTAFEGIASFRTELDRLNVRLPRQEASTLAWCRLVSGNYFTVLGVTPLIGRVLSSNDESLTANPVAVISHSYWQRAFQGSTAVIGEVVNMNGIPVTIAGVAPEKFFGESIERELADIWLPVTLQPRVMMRRNALEDSVNSWLNLIGRLTPGSSVARAEAELNVALAQHLRQLAGPSIKPEQEQEIRKANIALSPGSGGVSFLRYLYTDALYILMAVVGLVLLIACANVANLLLARATAREKEMSMRLALGAGRMRLIRQLLVESLLLAGLGGAVGVALASWMTRLLLAGISTGDRMVPLDVAPDGRVLGFTLAVSLLTGILFGLAPALRASRVDVWPALKGTSSLSPSGSPRRFRLGLAQALIVAQVGLSVPLLAGAALFVQTLRQLQNQDLGFRPANVLEVGIDPLIAGYEPDRLESLYRNLLERVQVIPGVQSASLSLYSPMSGNNWSSPVEVEGHSSAAAGEETMSQWVWTGPRYLETTGMTLLRGREFSPGDVPNSRKVAIVNETFVAHYLQGRDPIGRQFAIPSLGVTQPIEIVGIVKDVKFNSLRQTFRPVAFMPITQAPIPPAKYARFLEVRGAPGTDPATLASTIRAAIQETDRNLPVTSIKTLEKQIADGLTRENLTAGVSSFFAALALALACIGVYGVLAYAVAKRGREIGIRMAIGARKGMILRMVLREVLLLSLAGIAIGLVAAVFTSNAIAAQLYGLKATDTRTLAGVALVLAACAALAGLLPALRASRVDPMVTLRAD
jgi:predicted permease